MKKTMFVLFFLAAAQTAFLAAAQTASAKCSKELLSPEEAERGSWSINFGLGSDIIDVLNGVRGPSDVANAAVRINCFLVDAKITRSIQDIFLSRMIGGINLTNARDYHLETLATALATYGASLADIGRSHDANSVAIFVFEEQPKLLPLYLSALRQRGYRDYTTETLPQIARTRKLEDYQEEIAQTDDRVAELLAGRSSGPPDISLVLAAIEKDEDRALRFSDRGRLQAISIFLGDWQDPVQELRIIDGQPKNIVHFLDWSPYTRAVAEFEGREVMDSEKLTVECRFSPEAIVTYGKQTDQWQVSYVDFSERRLVLECSSS